MGEGKRGDLGPGKPDITIKLRASGFMQQEHDVLNKLDGHV
jgi:hypothetical protein